MTIHLAGPMISQVQRCTRCGEVLTDYRGAMVPVDQAPLGDGFAVGAFVEVEGRSPRYAGVTPDQPNCQRRGNNTWQ